VERDVGEIERAYNNSHGGDNAVVDSEEGLCNSLRIYDQSKEMLGRLL
jgi:hypothetical protein